MSAGEVVALMQGLLDRDQDQSRSPKMTRRPDVGSSSRTEMESAQPEIRRPAPVLHPENSCCFCLTLRSGTAIISILHSIFYLGLIIWYLSTSSLDLGGVRDGNIISSLDICLFSISTVMILVNILLLVSAVREIPCQTLPWLCANSVVIVIAMIMIVFTILFGTTKFNLNYSEYVTVLSLMGFMTGVTLFCWIVVFTFRKNLLMESEYSAGGQTRAGGKFVGDHHPTAPPPAYSEIEGLDGRGPPSEEPGPPGYDVVMSQSQGDNSLLHGPVLRKKSLTNHAV